MKLFKSIISCTIAFLMMTVLILPAFAAETSQEKEIRNTDDSEKIIVIDPGHGGNDVGGNENGLLEKSLNLSIARYCKKELEHYYDVRVYLTRNSDVRLSEQEIIDCVKNVNADLLVSIHINAGGDPGSGVEVYCQNQNYRLDLSAMGAAVGQSILEELSALGLKNRGVKTRTMSETDSAYYTYADGSAVDYYFINRDAKENGYCGIIVEHGFIDNPSDVANFLDSEAKLKKLGIADATGIANYFQLTKKSPIIIAMPFLIILMLLVLCLMFIMVVRKYYVQKGKKRIHDV